MIHFAAVGHVTNDQLEAGLFPGGAALYAALTAAKLQAKPKIVTSCGPDFVGLQLARGSDVELEILPSEHTTCFEEHYRGGARVARLVRRANPLCDPLPKADVVFVCPVIGEIELPALVAPPGALLAAGLQGWTRRFDENGRILRCALKDPAYFSGCRALFCSDEDFGPFLESAIQVLRDAVDLLIVTQGHRGAVLYENGQRRAIRPCPAREVDPTGAGDVFAACFLLGLAEGASAVEAAERACCAAAISIEGVGPQALTELRHLPTRLEEYRTLAP
jgi:1D-myo-inositol 3-kinase